jgi:hypothetical protein
MNLKLRKYNRKLPLRYFAKAEELDAGDGGSEGAMGGGGGAGESDGNGEGTASPWGDDWREKYAGEDADKLARVSRYASPTAAFDGLIALQNKVRSGEFKSTAPYPTDGKPEEQAQWRAENGIPEAPDKYDLTFDNGLVIGEDDKPIIDDFLSFAHDKNLSPDAVKAAVEWKFQHEEKMAEARAEQDAEVQQSTEDALRAEWGNEYRANINRITGLLDTAPEGVKDQILGARFQDGTPLASDPGTLKWLIDMALQINPATTLVPGAGDNVLGAVEDEIKTLEGMMGNRSSEYWKGPKAADMQKRYRDLVAGREKMK